MSYTKWDTTQDALLTLELVGSDGLGLTGSLVKTAIKRVKNLSGSFLDGYYWTGSSFSSTPTFLTMSEPDSTNFPGIYQYCFSQSLERNEYIYHVYFKSEGTVAGIDFETHMFENKLSGSIKIYEQEAEI